LLSVDVYRGVAVAGMLLVDYQFLRFASPTNASMLFAVATVLSCWALMWLLYSKRIFMKI